MRLKVIIVMSCLLLSVTALRALVQEKKQALRVLYVGYSPDRPLEKYSVYNYSAMAEIRCADDVRTRMPAFEEMLKRYFTEVSCVDARDYREVMSKEFDVTVFDALPRELAKEGDEKYMDIRVKKYLSEKFDRPAVLIAQTAPLIGEYLGLKTDWYCLCLKDYAFHMRMSHPVFGKPFRVKPTLKPVATPGTVYNYTNGNEIPATIPMWRVQLDSGDGYRIGLVAHGNGFEDSPDAEVIAGGKSLKSVDAVSIGRHGNFLMWGFAASPEYMTSEAKTVLANAIYYISRFAGQRPIARKMNKGIVGRDVIRDNLKVLESKAYKIYCLRMKNSGRPAMSRDEFIHYYTHKDLSARFGKDYKACRDFLRVNMDYFYGTDYTFRVDEAVKSLGIPNNDNRLLNRCICMLERNEETEKAFDVLKRYTVNEFGSASEWREWFEKYKQKLFFTESGGYKFMVNDISLTQNVKAVPRGDTSQGMIIETSREQPVVVSGIKETKKNGGGEIVIKFRIHEGFHIYAACGKGCPFIMTRLEFLVPDGIQCPDTFTVPDGKLMDGDDSIKVYEGEVEFRQRYIGNSLALNAAIVCKITYQCCDNDICMPPVDCEVKVVI